MGLSLPFWNIQGLLTCTPTSRDSSIWLPQEGAGPVLQSSAVSGGHGQFSLVLQTVGHKTKSAQPYLH